MNLKNKNIGIWIVIVLVIVGYFNMDKIGVVVGKFTEKDASVVGVQAKQSVRVYSGTKMVRYYTDVSNLSEGSYGVTFIWTSKGINREVRVNSSSTYIIEIRN